MEVRVTSFGKLFEIGFRIQADGDLLDTMEVNDSHALQGTR